MTLQSYSDFLAAKVRIVVTATPSPNRLKELIHYAGFLDVMDTGEALTRWFQRNSEKANDLTLYPHKEREFWLWVNTWAVFLQKPSDLGFSDEGYDMPALDVRWREVPTRLLDGSFDRDGQGVLIRDEGSNIVAAAREKRESLGARIDAVRLIVDEDPADHFIVWHDLEDERRAIEKALPAARAVHGAQDLDLREAIVGDFADGRLSILAAKPVMLGSGGNLQAHCHRAVFAGITAKFNDFIQAIHRLQRFGQPHPVAIGEALSARDRLAKTFMSIAPGSPAPDVWHDVVRMRTLNSEQAAKGREKHICPLQFDVVDRLIERYSMRGETVYDPFGGLFTVPFRAIGLGRKGRAVELNAGYFADGVRHLQAKEREIAVPTLLQLFDAMRDSSVAA